MAHASVAAPRRGRPRKFAQPSSAVTLTLPDSVIAGLRAIDPDLSRAVVRIAGPAVKQPARRSAEITAFGSRAVIVVNPTKTLEQRTGVLLIPLADGRALIAFDESTTPARLELQIQDALEDTALPSRDAQVFADIRDILRQMRHSKSMTLRQRAIMVIEHSR